MAKYDYKCVNEDCEVDVVELDVPMDDYDKPQECEKCGEVMTKVFLTAPPFLGSDTKTGVKGWGVPPPRDDKKSSGNF